MEFPNLHPLVVCRPKTVITMLSTPHDGLTESQHPPLSLSHCLGKDDQINVRVSSALDLGSPIGGRDPKNHVETRSHEHRSRTATIPPPPSEADERRSPSSPLDICRSPDVVVRHEALVPNNMASVNGMLARVTDDKTTTSREQRVLSRRTRDDVSKHFLPTLDFLRTSFSRVDLFFRSAAFVKSRPRGKCTN